MVLKVALVVDNPLRDLDGLVLLAWQLAQRKVEAWLVPMYDQSFDVRAIGVDFVLLNYIRPNNLDHFYAYKAEGIKVGVLDTEGIAGRSSAEFAGFVGKTGGAQFADLYCVWGPAQLRALQNANVASHDRLVLTGCPRYDYCANPWRDAVVRPEITRDYVLINTNFALTNPKFSAGPGTELQTMLKVGYAPDVAARFVEDAKIAHDGMIELVQNLVNCFPQEHFVLRPHPFENKDPYININHQGNFEIRQEATSVEWLNSCKVLIHLNCSTALEANMLGKPALSPAWLDTETIRVPGPYSVSQHPQNLTHFISLLESVLKVDQEASDFSSQYIEDLYYKIDGHSADRVADSIVNVLRGGSSTSQVEIPFPDLRSRLILAARNFLGYKISSRLMSFQSDPKLREKKKSKLFLSGYIRTLIDRIEGVAPKPYKRVEISTAPTVDLLKPKLASGNAVRFLAMP